MATHATAVSSTICCNGDVSKMLGLKRFNHFLSNYICHDPLSVCSRRNDPVLRIVTVDVDVVGNTASN